MESNMEQFSSQFTKEDQRLLLELARKTIESGDENYSVVPQDLSPILKEKRGCFVTLNKNGSLRGCIGYILPVAQLFQAVIENAYNAAFTDPRFPPVDIKELDDIHIDISVLTVPKKLTYSDKDDLLAKLVPFKDGLIIKKGYASATFLPQVWEQLPQKKDFLGHLCMKAGLNSNEWEKGNLEVEIYQAEVFEE